eukprot:1119480-Prymnesium_polylepis.1
MSDRWAARARGTWARRACAGWDALGHALPASLPASLAGRTVRHADRLGAPCRGQSPWVPDRQTNHKSTRTNTGQV